MPNINNWNDTTPAAPSGKTNVKFQAGAYSGTTRNVSAYMPVLVGDSGSGGTSGAVPAPASGDAAAGKFLKADGTWTSPGGSGPYDLSLFFAGSPAIASQKLFRNILPRAVTFASGLSPSTAIAVTAATGVPVFSIQKNGVQFGTITFTNSASGVFAAASSASFNGTSDILSIVGPASPDPTLADIGIVLSGTR